jgi:hypothetical protein
MTERPTKSSTLAAVNRYLDERYEQFAKRMEEAWGSLPAFPYGHRGAVYCRLWDNHKEVLHALERHWLTWDRIAAIVIEDGLEGRWYKPPTGNAMRRVWGRVCQEMAERKGRVKT